MKTRVGVDIVEIKRFQHMKPYFFTRVFTSEENAYCSQKTRPAEHFAARFAVREAVLKALGCGWRGVGLQDVSVHNADDGTPYVILKNKAQRCAEEQGIQEIAISLSHTKELATANAIALIQEEQDNKDKEDAEDAASTKIEARNAVSTKDEVDQHASDQYAGQHAADQHAGQQTDPTFTQEQVNQSFKEARKLVFDLAHDER